MYILYNFAADTVALKEKKIKLGHILTFFTGAFTKPALGFDKSASLQFIHDEKLFATASTCDLILRIPTCYDKYSSFKAAMIESICNNDGFV